MACAWATFFCYGIMMVVSFTWGQKNYRVPYAWKKLVAYIAISLGLYGFYLLFQQLDFGTWTNRGFSLILFFLFGLLILNVERKEFQKLPYVGRLFIRKTTASLSET
jgi:hypothetical protein